MEYNDTLFKKLSDGWNATNGIDWKNTSDDKLKNYCCTVVELGIKPMLKDLLGENEIIPQSNSIILLEKETFAKLYIPTIYEERFYKDDFAKLSEETITDTTKIINNAYEIIRKKSSDIESCLPEGKSIQGFAYNEWQIINKDAAISELGMHLICHELMHTIANKTSVEVLRKEEMGDEDVNEYFARLATQYILSNSAICPSVIGGTTIEEMRKKPNGCHNAHGTYGTLLDKREWYKRMNEVNLKELADFYFKGDHSIEFINSIFRGSPEIDTQK